MRLGSAALLLGLMALVLLIVGSLETLRLAPRIAKVVAVQGEAVAVLPPRFGRKTTASRPLKPGMLVLAGTVLRTGPNGQVRLRWVDEVEVRIGPNTQLKVTRSSYDRVTKSLEALFRLNLGTVFVSLRRRLPAQSRLELQTPAITAAVRGTAFEVNVRSDGATRLKVAHGVVVVRLPNGTERHLQAGDQLFATPHNAATAAP
ncbi:hypothetical protein HRbin17_00896 [bacterium HR17]|uniref:FecR protein domain-containing protein n=1 Tax=Candidatus Fervidibacter japonicus TaxID=2035412 RepID=A0A2H5XB47_9BACT|nr:hypothetical protein HRbin17_00896 [bacterium HR17]